jgi:hypothetical protein
LTSARSGRHLALLGAAAAHLAFERAGNYDGYMLLLARDRGLPLLTLDGPLTEAAQRVGITVVEI